jgi:hypothetical protein
VNDDMPPTDAELEIQHRILMQRLMKPDDPAVLDWFSIASRLVESLTAISVRMAGSPDLTPADQEHIDRAAMAIRDFDMARRQNDF